MKLIKKRWLGLSLASTLIALGAFSTPALAADYSGNCAFIPNHVTGNAVVNDTTCVINTGTTLTVDGTLTINTSGSIDIQSNIVSDGKVKILTSASVKTKKVTSTNSDIIIQSTQNRVETENLTAGNSVQLDAGLNGAENSSWDILVKAPIIANKLQTNPSPDVHGNILLRAAGNISTKTVRSDGGLGAQSAKSGGIQIEAWKNGGAATEFVIGGPGINGVDGILSSKSTVGGGTNPAFVNGGVNITNGGTASSGGISVLDPAKIQVRASESRSGTIILNAQFGPLKIATGSLNANGAMGESPQGAGSIYLLAKTIDTEDGTVITASQGYNAAPTVHQVFLAAQVIRYKGTANGLRVLADGNGPVASFTQATLAPFQYLRPNNLSGDVNNMPWTFSLGGGELAFRAPLTLDGANDNGALLLSADGDNSSANVTGFPISISGSTVTIRSRAEKLHRVNIGYFGSFTPGNIGLEINTTDKFIVNADGKFGNGSTATQANGGIVSIIADQTNWNAPTHTISADGPPSGNGNGGQVKIFTTTAEMGDTSHANITANGAPEGIGDAIFSSFDSTDPKAVIFKPGQSNVVLGGGQNSFKILANGGSVSGHGGTVQVLPTTGHVRVRATTAIDVSAIGTACGACEAGSMQIKSSKIDTAANPAPTMVLPALVANGAGDGSGGLIQFVSTGNINLAGVAQAIGGADNGNGGSIDVKADTGIVAKGSGFIVAAGAEGHGGMINIDAGSGLLTFDGKFDASGGTGSGNNFGGQIEIKGGNIFLSATAVTELIANGHGSGKGGEINVTSMLSDLNFGAGADQLRIEATSEQAQGGNVSISAPTTGNITLNGSAVDVSAGGDGEGGNISVQTASGSISLSDRLQANGHGSGNGGSISLASASTADMTLNNVDVWANSGLSGGNGGTVSVKNTKGTINVNNASSIRVTALASNGNGGTVDVSAGSSAGQGGVTLTSGSDMEADAGLTSGDGGKITITYYSNNPAVAINTDQGTVHADGPNGFIEFKNASLAELRVSGDNTEISARDGRVTFVNPDGNVTAHLIQDAGPLVVGQVDATGVSVRLEFEGTDNLTIGNVIATSDAFIRILGGDISSANLTTIDTPLLKIGTVDGTIGSTNSLSTKAKRIEPAVVSEISKTVHISSTLLADTLNIDEQWKVKSEFVLNSPASSVIVEGLEQFAGQDGVIQIFALNVTVPEGKKITSRQGTILLSAGNSISLEKNAEIVASANASPNTALGNVLIEVVPASSLNNCGFVANFDASLSAPPVQCGPAGFTALPPTNFGLALGRTITIYAPTGNEVLLGGGVKINALFAPI